MQKIKRSGRIYSDKKTRKKHVESMFLTNKQKNYAYYFKDRNIWSKSQNVKSKCSSPRFAFSIKILESGYIGLKPLKAIMRLFKWFVKTQFVEPHLRLRMLVFPDFVLTSKPKEMRMGKGKGAPDTKIVVVKAGTTILDITKTRLVSFFLVKQLALMVTRKVPLKHKVIFNNW